MKEIHIVSAQMTKQEDGTYIGKTIFEVEGHKVGYEISFFSKRGHDWDYSLHYAGEPGMEEQLLDVDAKIEQEDTWFDTLLDAAWNALSEN